MTLSVGIGLATLPEGGAAAFWRWIDVCEAGGVGSVWFSDRIVGRDPQPELLSTAAAVAGRTRRLRIGLNAASLGLRDPVITAKACATIDVLSEGRLLPVFGIGSKRSRDWSATGRSTKGRGRRMDEALEIVSRLWRGERVDLDGEHFRLDGAEIAPLPVQDPMTLWVGGSAPQAVERTARWGTGWQGGIETPAQVAPVVAAIRARTAELGRTIDDDHYGAGFAFRFGSADDAPVRRFREGLGRVLGREPDPGLYAVGDADAILARMRDFRAAGIEKFILRPLAADGAELEAQTRAVVEQLLPRLGEVEAAAPAVGAPAEGAPDLP